MASISSDTLAEMEMLIEDHLKLQKVDPVNPILRFVELHADERGFTPSREYIDKYIHDSDEYKIQGYMRYRQDLLKELLRIG